MTQTKSQELRLNLKIVQYKMRRIGGHFLNFGAQSCCISQVLRVYNAVNCFFCHCQSSLFPITIPKDNMMHDS